MATVPNVDFMNRKQLRRVARDLGVPHTEVTTKAALITAIKAK